MAKYYELLDKLNRCKEKYKKDISKLQFEIKKRIGTIDDLYKRIEEMKGDYYYQLWLKERMKLIKRTKENNKLLDENTILKRDLIVKIESGLNNETL